jgi:hypothetical protein
MGDGNPIGDANVGNGEGSPIGDGNVPMGDGRPIGDTNELGIGVSPGGMPIEPSDTMEVTPPAQC